MKFGELNYVENITNTDFHTNTLNFPVVYF